MSLSNRIKHDIFGSGPGGQSESENEEGQLMLADDFLSPSSSNERLGITCQEYFLSFIAIGHNLASIHKSNAQFTDIRIQISIYCYKARQKNRHLTLIVW